MQEFHRPRIALTMGDPAGIGPELCLRILRDPVVAAACIPVVFGDIEVLLKAADRTGLSSPPQIQTLAEWNRHAACTEPCVVDCGAIRTRDFHPGRVQASCGKAAAAYIEAAVGAALQSRVRAVVTSPISKEALHLAGIKYPGHTEMLAALTKARSTCMMMASDDIIVSLATIHIGIAQVKAALTRESIFSAIELTAKALMRLGRKSPHIAVCGLNPHGGEGGLFGREEKETIEPAILDAHKAGICVTGPLAPDTAFVPGMRAKVDAFVAMYHDQGLIPFKMLAFEKGVNVTLGLPIVRTSPDHGTAFDIAWTGKASPSSLLQAVQWAMKLAGARAA
jgi:4-phospho-D-threonate 3-dehydrogenase / 4-phospho-D-erythronate 3-dehydrogenase